MPRTSPYRADERLDDWIPDPAVRTHHRRSAAATPEALWDAARAVRLSDTRTLERLVRWRIPGVVHGQTYDELFRTDPFTLLDEGDDLVGLRAVRADLDARARLPARSPGPEDVPRLGPARAPCACCSRTGPSRVTDGRSTLVSEARVDPVDRDGARCGCRRCGP